MRKRLKEIEAMMSSNLYLNENILLAERYKEREKEFQQEREMLIEKHEIRVRQLTQETVDARFYLYYF